MMPPFALEGYRQIIRGLLDRGYTTRSFHDADASARHLVLRHDIDQSIARAREMADLESSEGWRSTWFVLVRTEMYNPFSREASSNLRGMCAAGHEIGLHLDASYYGDSNALDAGCAVECRMLEDMLGAPVRIVSFHRPAATLLGGDTPVAGRLHTYMDCFTKAFGYCSDSRGEWRHGHPFDHPAVAESRALQLLTHPVWWVGTDGRDRLGRLSDVLNDARTRLETELTANNEVWREATGRAATVQVPLDPRLLEALLPQIVTIAADVPGEYWKAEHFRTELPRKWELSWLLFAEGRVIGYAIMSERGPGHCHLHHLMLARDRRSRGEGGELLASAMRHAAGLGYRRFTLKVDAGNEGAIRFYGRHGFRRGTQTAGYLELVTDKL